MLNFRPSALLTLAALSLALAAPLAPAFAQAPPPALPMHGPHGGQRPNPLGITDAQKARMRPIFMNAGRQYQALQANTSLTPAARMAKMQALQRSTQMQMMAILTPAQRTKVKAMMQARAARMSGSGFGGPHP